MVNKGKKNDFVVEAENQIIFGLLDNDSELTLNVPDLIKGIEDYGEWKELIGFLRAKNLNPKLVKKYIEAVLEIEKLSD